MTRPIKIDFVSDISCPWCVIGLKGLEQALARVDGAIEADIRFHPFELNPHMPPEGQRLVDYASQRYGSTPEQLAERRAIVRERAAALGFTISLPPEDGRVFNTFNAHRLLHWARDVGRQRELKMALFEAYFSQCLNPGDREVLATAAERAGLDRREALEVLDSGRFAEEVRDAERHWQAKGISAVPAIVINDRYLISGGQPAEVFEQALRQIAESEPAGPAAS